MPFPGYNNVTSSDLNTGGAAMTRTRGPLIVGQLNDNASGPLYPPSGIMVVQSSVASSAQIITTTAQTANAAYVYIPHGSVGVTSSSNATIAAAPPYTGIGAALYFDYTRKKLSIYSTGAGDWLSVTLSSS